MKIVSVNELKGNEIAAQVILTSDYQMILPAGFQIKVKYIDKLLSLGIAKVYIKDERSQQEEISILKEDVEVSMKEKVKEVMKFSGPRLIIYNPLELIRHALNK